LDQYTSFLQEHYFGGNGFGIGIGKGEGGNVIIVQCDGGGVIPHFAEQLAGLPPKAMQTQ
jgi:hypothetical protein